MDPKIKLQKGIKYGIIAAVVFVIIIVVYNCFTVINAGEVGIKTRFGKVVDTQLNEGLNLKFPFIENIVKISVKLDKIEVESSGASRDLQDIKMNLAVNYHVIGEKAPNLYRTIGKDYKNVILVPAIQETIKAVVSEYTAEELITKRQEVSVKATNELNEKVKNFGVAIDTFNIINFAFSEEFNNAIEEKQIAEQKVLKAKQELEKTKVEAQQKIENARAESEALKLQKQEITENLLKLREIENQNKAIEKWDGKLPTYMTGSSTPFLNIK